MPTKEAVGEVFENENGHQVFAAIPELTFDHISREQDEVEAMLLLSSSNREYPAHIKQRSAVSTSAT